MSINWTYNIIENKISIYKNDTLYANEIFNDPDDLKYFLAMVVNNVLVENTKNDTVNMMNMIQIIITRINKEKI